MTRPPNTKPATAYDYRRYIILVQMLALDKSDGLKLTDLRTLAEVWQVNPYGTFSELLQRLCQAVIEHQRTEATRDDATD